MNDHFHNGIFETSCRHLEQFLYMHGIDHIGWHKDAFNMTVWSYPDTEEVRFIVGEYRQAVAKRQAKRQ